MNNFNNLNQDQDQDQRAYDVARTIILMAELHNRQKQSYTWSHVCERLDDLENESGISFAYLMKTFDRAIILIRECTSHSGYQVKHLIEELSPVIISEFNLVPPAVITITARTDRIRENYWHAFLSEQSRLDIAAAGIHGCPLGRGETEPEAITDLVRRTAMDAANKNVLIKKG